LILIKAIWKFLPSFGSGSVGGRARKISEVALINLIILSQNTIMEAVQCYGRKVSFN
jgi:hypothetical protein